MILTTQQIAFRYIFTPHSRLAKARSYFLGVFPLGLIFDGSKVTEKLIEAGVIRESQVKRGIKGQIVSVFFREMPRQETVEIACLGLEGAEKIELLVKRGLA